MVYRCADGPATPAVDVALRGEVLVSGCFCGEGVFCRAAMSLPFLGDVSGLFSFPVTCGGVHSAVAAAAACDQARFRGEVRVGGVRPPRSHDVRNADDAGVPGLPPLPRGGLGVAVVTSTVRRAGRDTAVLTRGLHLMPSSRQREYRGSGGAAGARRCTAVAAAG